MDYERVPMIRMKYNTVDVFGNYLGVDAAKLLPTAADLNAAIDTLGNGAVYFDVIIPTESTRATIYKVSVNLFTSKYSIEKRIYDGVKGYATPEWCKHDVDIIEEKAFLLDVLNIRN